MLVLMFFDFHSILRLPVSLHLYEGIVALLSVVGVFVFHRLGVLPIVFAAIVVAGCLNVIVTHPMCRDPWFCRAERIAT